jgi:hypothetical protein
MVNYFIQHVFLNSLRPSSVFHLLRNFHLFSYIDLNYFRPILLIFIFDFSFVALKRGDYDVRV